jgi:hypothetical protein
MLVNTANIFDNATLRIGSAWGVTSAFLNGLPYLYVSGFESGISAFAIGASGQLTSVGAPGGNVQDDGATAIAGTTGLLSLTAGSNSFLYATGYTENGVTSFALNPASGVMTTTDRDVDSGGSPLQLAGAIDIASTTLSGGTRCVFVAGYNDEGISSFFVDPTTGALTTGAGIGYHVSDGADPFATIVPNLNGIRSLATAVVGSQTYLFAAAELDSALVAFTVSSTGTLTYNQSVLDNATFKLAGARAVATALVGDKTYIFAGGGVDDGISVFFLPPGGVLSNPFNLADDATRRLDGITDLVTTTIAGTTYLFATGSVDDGISVLPSRRMEVW